MSSARRALRCPQDVCEIESDFALAVVEGLSKAKKTLPCRYFYDARGSELFEEITRLPEYYPTRTEARILAEYADEIVDGIADGGLLVEFGSGSSLKTEILLDRVASRIAYVPIDVSETALAEAKARLSERYPSLDVRPIMADFSKPVALPRDLATRQKTGFFPGSTIGNLAPHDAGNLLAALRRALGTGGRLIIGVDLKKDARTLVSAYDDAAGVTAAFNLNLLSRINRELQGTFKIEAFRHEAIYDPREGRIEMHLVSTREQDVELCGRRFHFRDGESIHTENSYKYAIEQFRDLALASGWEPRRVWTDAAHQFSVHEFDWPSVSWPRGRSEPRSDAKCAQG
jgi:dimethylhistidine N-methyltransferase